MLVPFCIDSESLDPDPTWTPAQVYQCHRALLDSWRRIGLLAYDGETFSRSRLRCAIDKLPPKLKPLWQEVLEHHPLISVGESWNGSISENSLGLLSKHVRLGIVDDARAEVEFGFADDDLSRHIEHYGIEISRMLSASQANHFVAAQNESGKYIRQGECFSEIWKKRFQTLAHSGIKRISIVDRYSIGQLFNPPHQQLCGLERFLRLLDADADGIRHVKVFASWADLSGMTANDVQHELQLVMSKLPRKKIVTLKVIMAPNSIFGRIAHDRFIRFENYVWEIGSGLKVFAGAFAEVKSTASFKYGDVVDGYSKVEHDLECDADAKLIGVS
jgi:hypothetical protein